MFLVRETEIQPAVPDVLRRGEVLGALLKGNLSAVYAYGEETR